ncbi:PAS domain-containing protein [Calothrix sp. FACHB-156]|nr:PAS domain-containing protein [Calothrix sp. FACHB-156]
MSQSQRTVLIVDDNPEDCELYRQYLLQDWEYQYTVVVAELGQTGLQLWQVHQPDMVLLDYRLPDIDGLEFLNQLQAITRQPFVPVIVVTGQGNEAIAVQAMQAGAQNYLVKGGITPEEMRLAVNGAIENLQLRTQLQQRIEKERLITQITQQIYKSLNFHEILQITVNEVRQFLQTDRVIIFQLFADGSGQVVAESVGEQWQSVLASSIFDPCLAEEYIERYRQGLLNQDPSAVEDYIERYRQGLVTATADIYDGTIDSCHVELLTQFHVRANLVVPILHDRYFWGMLIAHHCTVPREWQQLEIDLLQELATQVSIALRQAEALQQAQHELAERKRAEAILQDNEETLRVALEASHMGTWDWNIVTGKIKWSANLEALFGLAPGEFDGRYETFVARLHPDDRDRVIAAINTAISTGTNYNIEFRVVYPNGNIRWALSQGKVFYDDSGQAVRMAGVDLDITERKHSEAELRENAAWLKLAQKATKSGLWDLDLTTGKAKISEEYCTLLGLDPGTREIRNDEWLQWLHPDDRSRISEYVGQMMRERRQYYDTEFRILHPDGERWLAARAQVFYDAAGNAVRKTGNVQDITARKRAEAELRESERRNATLAEAVPVAIFRFDTNNNCIYVNNHWSEITGRPIHAALGLGWIETLHPEDRDRIVREAPPILKPGESYQNEGRCLRPDGSIVWVYAQILPETDSHGNVIGNIGTLTDITERKQAEEQLRLQVQVLAQTHDSVISTNLDGYITSWNQGAERVFGYSAEEALGQHLQLLYPQPQMRLVLETEVIAPLKAKGEHEVEVTAQCKSGEIKDVLLSLSLLRDQNQHPVGMIGLSMDITARKLAEAALRENEQLLRLALSGAHAGSWNWEIQANKINWSPENYDLYGLDPSKNPIQYEDWYNTLHPDDKEAANAEVIRVVEQRLPEFNTEFRIVHPQRGICWLLALARVTFDNHGQPVRLSGINLDISDRKRAEEELRQSEEFNQRMLASSNDCIKVLDLDGRLLYINPGGICLLEIDDLTPLLHTEWRCFWEGEMIQAADNAIALAKAGELARFQGYCPTAKGTPKWWDVVLTPIRNPTGQVIQLLCISRDITDYKQAEKTIRQSEARYRYLAEAIPHLVWTCDAQGNCDYVNQRLCEYTGLKFEQALEFGWLASVHPEDMQQTQDLWKSAVANSTFYKHEYRFRRHSDGSYRWHLILGLPLKDEQEQVMKWFGTCTDIHDQKELEIERDRILQLEQVARNEAERANRIKDEFLAILSHELRSPLNPILGWTKLLQSRRLDENKTAEALATIERNAKLQTQLIDDLLDIARILRGKLSLNADNVNLTFVIEAAIDTIRTAAVAKSILIHPELRNIGQVSGDAVRLQQVVWNLLSNAIKFTPNGGRVDIRLERVDQQAQIIVSDTGKGINPDFLPYIFESFRQEDVSITRKYGGLGLGLAIVRHIIEAHGGTVAVNSLGEGQGATFTVSLPLLNIEPESDRTEDLSADELNLVGIKILTIDDEPDSRDFLTVLLDYYGAEVVTVTTSYEFLAALESFEPDILVSDIGMPKVDGYTLMRQVRSLPPERGGQTPAIALTAYAGEINQQQALAAGFQKHLSKPIDPDLLVQAVAQLVQISN